MKKLVFGLTAIFILSFNVNAQNTIDKLSTNFLDMGIESISVKKISNGNEYNFKTFKKCYINATSLDIKRFKIINDGNLFFLLDIENPSIDKKYSITLNSKNQITNLTTPLYNGDLNYIDKKLYDDSNFMFLYLFLREINLKTDQQLYDYSAYQENNLNRGCSFWNTYYSVGIGASSAGALAHLTHVANNAIQSGDLDGCTLLSSRAETNSYGGIYVSTITWCCT